MIQELENLRAAVEAEHTVIESAVALIQGLKGSLDIAIEDLQNNPRVDPADLDALRDLATEVGNNADALAAAVEANTVPAPVA